jgi:hypothetical protein
MRILPSRANQRPAARPAWPRMRWLRLRASAPRHLATAALVGLCLLGARALLLPAPPPAPPRKPLHADAPSEELALRFARAYLTFDPARPGLRTRLLSAFLPQGAAPEGAFGSTVAQRVRWLEIASDQRSLLGGRLITVAAGVSTQEAPLYLAVAVRHKANKPLSLLGYPAFVGPPLATSNPQLPFGEEVTDPAVVEVAKRVIANYLERSPQDLRADLSPRAEVSLPTVALSLQRVEAIEWIGTPRSGALLLTLSALDARGSSYRLAYELGIESRERPYIDFIEVLPSAG